MNKNKTKQVSLEDKKIIKDSKKVNTLSYKWICDMNFQKS
jgi:hypothetical protein